MQDDRTLQPIEDARTIGIIAGELRRVFARSPQSRPLAGIIRSNDVNGFRDANGDYQEWWLLGDEVTENGTGSKEIAPY